MHAKGVTKVHFLTPFLNSIGYATVDNVIVKLPLNLDLQYDLNDKKFSVKYEPSKAAYEMFHYDVKPLTYTKTYPNINYTPLPIVYNPEPHVVSVLST